MSLAEPPAPEPFDTGVLDWTPSSRPSWTAQAACVGRTQLFFGSNGERPQRRARREARARALCASCPVFFPCREHARRNRENGFWGGESEEERAAAGFPPLVISRRSVQWAAAAADAVPVSLRTSVR